MNTHTRKNLKPWLVPATWLVILAGVFVAPTAFTDMDSKYARASELSTTRPLLVNI
jgi:hypothetical protein